MSSLKLNPASCMHKFLLVMLAIVMCHAFNAPVYAHTHQQKTVVVDNTPLAAFEGIYQDKGNEFSYFKVAVAGDKLLAKQMDGDRQLTLTRKSDLAFETLDDDGDETIPVVFTKNDAGAITQALFGGRQVFLKVKSYVPVQEVKLTADELKTFEGKYQFEEKQDMSLQITATPGGLTLKQGWDGREVNFISVGNLTFLNKQAGFPLKFSKDASGNVIKVLAFNRDMWDKVKE